MDIVSEKSPGSSPPISPIKITTHGAHDNSPPSNFPNWSRTSLERATLVKSIPKDVKERKILFNSVGVAPSVVSSSGTQTDFTLAVVDDARCTELEDKLSIEKRKVATLEKNFKFVVLHHEDVMMRLRQEVGELKSENKDLNFRLVMTEGQVSSVQSAFSDENGRLQCSHCKGSLSGDRQAPGKKRLESSSSRSAVSKSSARSSSENGEKLLEVKVVVLKEEITKLKAALQDAKMKNSKLSHLIEQQQLQFDAGRWNTKPNPAKPEPPSVPKSSLHEKHRPGNFGHQPLDRLPRGHVQTYQRSAQHADKPPPNELSSNLSVHNSFTDSADMERKLIAEQQERLRNDRNKEIGHGHSNTSQQKQRSHGPVDNQTRIEERLPPIMVDSLRLEKFTNPSHHHKETVTLPPVLQPAPPSNRKLTDRQKRAKALHVQRQRNNREFTTLL